LVGYCKVTPHKNTKPWFRKSALEGVAIEHRENPLHHQHAIRVDHAGIVKTSHSTAGLSLRPGKINHVSIR
jgi:hypothetical protein